MMQKNLEPEKIFIELDDEITFIAEKVRNALSERVVLIVPDNAMLLSSLISVKILYKELLVTDKSSIFIVKDDHGFSLIKKLNLEVVKNANEIDEDMWVRSRMKIEESIKEQNKKKSELLEKRNLQKTEVEEKEIQRVDEIIGQAEREGTNEVTHAIVKDDIQNNVKEDKDGINYDLYKKPRRLPARVQKLGDRVFASGGDISDFEEVRDNIKLDELRDTPTSNPNNISSGDGSLVEEGKGNLLNKNFNKHTGDFLSKDKTDLDMGPANLLDRSTKRQINSDGNVFKKALIFIKNVSEFVVQRIESFTVNRKGILIIVPIVLVFIVFVILSLTVFPSANIKLSSTSSDFTATENVTANLTTQVTDVTNLTLPIEVLIVNVNGSQSLATTQEKEIGTTKATGSVTFYNKTDNAINVPANTELTIKVGTTNLTYLTTQAITVNKKTTSIGGETWGSKDVAVVAGSAGSSYNLANQGTSTFTISGFASTSIIATMYPTGTFTGGASKKTKVVSQADIDKLKKELTETLKAEAKAEEISKYGLTYVLLTPDGDFQMDTDKLSATVGQEASILDYELTAKGSIKGVSKANIELLAKEYTENKLKEFGEVEVKNSNSKYELTKFEKDIATISLSMNATYYVNVNLSKIKDDLKSKTLSEANTILGNINPNTKITKIELFPTYLPEFFKKFPTDASKIEISIEKK